MHFVWQAHVLGKKMFGCLWMRQMLSNLPEHPAFFMNLCEGCGAGKLCLCGQWTVMQNLIVGSLLFPLYFSFNITSKLLVFKEFPNTLDLSLSL